jgi:hypothetical protein
MTENNNRMDELRRALSVEPRPGFEARVRERIRHEAQQAPAWRLWRAAAAVTAAAGIGLVFWIAPGRRPAVGRTGPDPTPSIALSSGAAAPGLTASRSSTTVRPAPPGRAGQVARVEAPRREEAAASAKIDVVVAPDQAIGVERWLAGLRQDRPARPVRPARPAPRPLLDPETGLLLPLRPVEIPEITITALVPPVVLTPEVNQ